MGNCQAIDNASLIIQHPSGRVHHLFSPATAGEIMKMNPGHYVALLLTTTLYSSAAAAEKDYASRVKNSSVPLRVTRIKLLRATDTLALGHVYRLVTAQEVMKGLGEKKLEKMKQDQKQSSDFDAVVRMTHGEKTKQDCSVFFLLQRDCEALQFRSIDEAVQNYKGLQFLPGFSLRRFALEQHSRTAVEES